jgi:hypothetical protein
VGLSTVSVRRHQTWLTETLVAELEGREIDWSQRKHSQVKGKAVLSRVMCRICRVCHYGGGIFVAFRRVVSVVLGLTRCVPKL